MRAASCIMILFVILAIGYIWMIFVCLLHGGDFEKAFLVFMTPGALRCLYLALDKISDIVLYLIFRKHLHRLSTLRKRWLVSLLIGSVFAYGVTQYLMNAIISKDVHLMRQASIARTLNEEGIKTRQGAKWATSSIEYLLSNERYAGDSRLQKYYSTDFLPKKRKINHGEHLQYYVQDTHEGIVSKETFEKAQVLLQRHAHYVPPLPKPFQKKIVCPDCGNYFRETTIRGKKYWICRNRRNNQAPCKPIRFTEQQIQRAFLNLAGKIYAHGDTLLSPTLSLLEEIAARQEQGNTKLYELNGALADLNEKTHTLQRLHNKGFIEDADFREQSDALASQRKKLSDQRSQALHGSKALETLDKLREFQEQLVALPEIPWEFDIDLFDQLVEKIIPISNTELLFKLKCGLELKEVLPK